MPKVLRFLPCLLAALALLMAACSPKEESRALAADIELDRQVWRIYTELSQVRRDVDETIKRKGISIEEASACFKRHENTLKHCAQELEQLKNSDAVRYSHQVKALRQAMETSLAIVKETYRTKHLADIDAAGEVLRTINELSKSIPLERTKHLLAIGCTVDDIYESFRNDGFSDSEIQEYVLQAQNLTREVQVPVPTSP